MRDFNENYSNKDVYTYFSHRMKEFGKNQNRTLKFENNHLNKNIHYNEMQIESLKPLKYRRIGDDSNSKIKMPNDMNRNLLTIRTVLKCGKSFSRNSIKN